MRRQITFTSMKVVILYLMLLLSAINVYPQTDPQLFPPSRWLKDYKPGHNNNEAGLAAAPNGDVAVAFKYYQNLTFTTVGDTTLDTVNTGASTKSNILVVVYDSAGHYKFHKEIGGLNNDNEVLGGIGYDGAGNLYIGGKYKDSLNIDGVLQGSLQVNPNLFIIKINSEGDVLWAKNVAEGSSSNIGIVQIYDFKVSSSGNLFICGSGDPKIGESQITPYCAFIAKYDSEGEPVWAKPYNYSVTTAAVRTTLFTMVIDDNENIYACGEFSGTVDYGVASLTSKGARDMIVIGLDSEGSTRWVSGGGSPNEDRGYSMALKNNDELFVLTKAGGFGHPFEIDGQSYDSTNSALIKYNSEGSVIGVVSFQNADIVNKQGIAFDKDGNVIFALSFFTTYEAKVNDVYYKSRGGTDILFLKYSSDLNFILSQHFGTFQEEGVNALYSGADNEIYCQWYSFGQTGIHLNKIMGFYPTVVDVRETGDNIPASFILSQNYPNPFNPSTKISFSVPEREFVTLKIFNAIGEEIALLLNHEINAGNYELNWDAGYLSSGIYFYSITAGSFSQSMKMILAK